MTITLPHTTFFTSILGLWTIFLAIRVIQLRIGRNKYKKYEEETVERAVRGHGNLIENTPIFFNSFFHIRISAIQFGIPSNSWLVIRDWEIDAWYLFRIYETKYAP